MPTSKYQSFWHRAIGLIRKKAVFLRGGTSGYHFCLVNKRKLAKIKAFKPPTHKARASGLVLDLSSFVRTDPDHLRLRLQARQMPALSLSPPAWQDVGASRAQGLRTVCDRSNLGPPAVVGLFEPDAFRPDIFPGLFVRAGKRKGLAPHIFISPEALECPEISFWIRIGELSGCHGITSPAPFTITS